jgi:DNA-binding GntR family transcriptional regulator
MARNTRGRVSADEVGTVRRLRYEQVFDFVVALIADQGLVPGDRLPSSTDLADLTGVSLISVRRALDELERGGKVQRQQGVGTFVAHERIRAEPTRTGELLGTLVDGNPLQEISTKLLGIAVGRPSDNIVRALAIEAGQPVWELSRLRSIGRSAAILEQAVLPLSLVPALDEARLAAGESLYRFLEDRYGLRDEYAEQVLEVDHPTARERNALQLGPRDQVARIRGVSFDSKAGAFDCYQQTYRARDFVFYTAGANNNQQLLQPNDIGAWVVEPMTTTAPVPAKRRR